jgi:Glyoxalase/Bleomycin resistance protein/Dioxygenase superfamily
VGRPPDDAGALARALAQGARHRLQEPEGEGLVGRGEPGQHPDLHRPDRRARLLESGPAEGRIGAAIWMHATDVQAVHDALVADGHTVTAAPFDGPFGRTFTFADPDGYLITLHDRV